MRGEKSLACLRGRDISDQRMADKLYRNAGVTKNSSVAAKGRELKRCARASAKAIAR